jgi:multidrug efflux system membrane fusion protein
VTEGNLVQAGTPSTTLLTTLVSVDPIYLYFDTDEQTFLRYAAGAGGTDRRAWRDGRRPVYVGLANEVGYPHEGRLDFVDNQLNPNSGTIRARAVFNNRDRLFTPGLFARVKVGGGRKTKAVLVRDAAIGTDQDKRFVLVLKADGTVNYRGITLGRVTDGLRVVTSGLAAGEKVVVNGLQRVRPGAKVAATAVAMVEDSSVAAPVAGTAGSR